MTMPIWVALYFAGYVTFSLWTHVNDFRKGKISPWAVYEVIGNVSLLLPAFTYWYPQLYSLIGKAMIPLFVFGLTSVMLFAYHGFRKNSADPELSASANIGLNLFGAILLLSVTSPLAWWGWKSISSRF